MATALDDTLTQKVHELEAKSERIEREKNTEQKVERVTSSLARVNNELSKLEETASELSFYVAVLEEVFDDSRSSCPKVDDAVEHAQNTANIEEPTLLEAAEDHSLAEVQDDISNARDDLEDAISSVRNRIEDEYQTKWQSKLASALELNSIIGGTSGDFGDHIRSMQSFINQDIWRTDKQPSGLAARWDRFTDEWRQRSGKHGWTAFQREHALSDATIDELKQFTQDEPVHLSDLSLSTLEETKQVEELESALQVELQSQ